MYVASTGDEEYCMRTYAKSRFRNGQINACNPSRFLNDIDSAFLSTSGNITLINRFDSYSEKAENTFFNKKTEKNIDINVTKKDQDTFSKYGGNSNLPNFVKVKNATPKSPSANVAEVQEGNIIKHERFGIGKVLSVSGDPESRKATVEFENSGTKQLLLKFARFEVVG